MNKYVLISNTLRDQILKENIYGPDSRLPSEWELGERYGASKMTVKKALDILVEEGLIYKKRGHGTFVKGLSPQQMNQMEESLCHAPESLTGFSRKHRGEDVSTTVLEFSIQTPTRKIAANLHISEEDFVYRMIRVRSLNSVPCVLEETYMPIETIPGLKLSHAQSSVYSYIRDVLHCEIQSSHIRILVKQASGFTAESLKIPEGSPVAVVEQIAFLNNGMPFEYSLSTHRADSFDYTSVIVRKP